MNSKRKGNGGELEFLHLLEDAGLDAHRNQQGYIGGTDNPDVALHAGGQQFHVEVKRTERFFALRGNEPGRAGRDRRYNADSGTSAKPEALGGHTQATGFFAYYQRESALTGAFLRLERCSARG